MNHVSQNRSHGRGGKLRVAPAMTLGLALLLTGCESLLEVSLPGTLTTEDLKNPELAEVLVNSAIAAAECSYARFTNRAAGMEEVFYDFDTSYPNQYQDVINGSSDCGTTLGQIEFYVTWYDRSQQARFLSEDIYERLTDWTDDNPGGELDISGGLVEWDSREQMLGASALYAAIPYIIWGEHLCDITVELSELMTPNETLLIAEDWINTALVHIEAYVAGGGDPRYPYGITGDSEVMAYGLRARIRWARGDLAGAAADAALVPDGFFAFATRSDLSEPERQNPVWGSAFDGGVAGVGLEVTGPVDWWVDPHVAGKYPAPAGGWPLNGAGPEALIPFTGYLDLAIAADGRAVDPAGNALTTATAGVGFVADSRVSVGLRGPFRDGDDHLTQLKFVSAGQSTILINWMEMRLIEAEANTANAVTMVNRVRADDPALPLVAYAPSADDIEDMIFEERRRALWLEGRFWSTKIMNQKASGTKLWFPRELDQQSTPLPNDEDLQGGVRLRMQTAEFDRNPNIDRNDRSTKCGDYQRPVSPVTMDDED